jgi:hypothetical protein
MFNVFGKVYAGLIINLLFPFFVSSCSKTKDTVDEPKSMKRELYLKSPGSCRGRPSEGFAVFGNYAFILYDTGICDVYDLTTKDSVNNFQLGSYMKSNHANVADFGVEYPKGNNNFPAFYVSECLHNTKRRCFVESITTERSEVVQVISVDPDLIGKSGVNYIVDRANRRLYAVGRDFQDAAVATKTIFTVFRLPALSEGENVKLTVGDMIEQYDMPVFKIPLQGAFIRNDRMYLLTGNRIGGRAFYAIDLTRKEVVDEVSLMQWNLEPEDLYMYDGAFLVNHNGGGVYKFSFKIKINNTLICCTE